MQDRIIKGPIVKKFSAGVEISDLNLEKYFGLRVGDRNYKVCKKPCRFDRYSVQTENGFYFTFPDNQNTRHFRVHIAAESNG
jgi:hypothetical protein